MKRSHTLVLALIRFMALGVGSGSKTPPETATVQELRNEAGRAPFNCVVLGKTVEVQFGAPGAAPR